MTVISDNNLTTQNSSRTHVRKLSNDTIMFYYCPCIDNRAFSDYCTGINNRTFAHKSPSAKLNIFGQLGTRIDYHRNRKSKRFDHRMEPPSERCISYTTNSDKRLRPTFFQKLWEVFISADHLHPQASRLQIFIDYSYFSILTSPDHRIQYRMAMSATSNQEQFLHILTSLFFIGEYRISFICFILAAKDLSYPPSQVLKEEIPRQL